jgi:hypothetical protein
MGRRIDAAQSLPTSSILLVPLPRTPLHQDRVMRVNLLFFQMHLSHTLTYIPCLRAHSIISALSSLLHKDLICLVNCIRITVMLGVQILIVSTHPSAFTAEPQL